MATPSSNSNRNLTVTLLIPVFNEEETLPHILPLIDPSWVDAILFVDGNSKDRSVEIIKKWGKGDVFIQSKPSLAEAYFESLPRIKTDCVLAFSPDGNSPVEGIPRIIQHMREGDFDMIIGSRYLPGAGSEDDDFLTTLGNRMFTAMINLLFGGHYTDTLVMYRIYKKSLVARLEMYPRVHCYEPMMAIRSAVHRCKVTEIPVSEPKRIGGERKMRVFENGFAILRMVASEWYRFLRLKIKGDVLQR